MQTLIQIFATSVLLMLYFHYDLSTGYLTVSSHSLSNSVALWFLLMLTSHLPPSLFFSSSHIGRMPSYNYTPKLCLCLCGLCIIMPPLESDYKINLLRIFVLFSVYNAHHTSEIPNPGSLDHCQVSSVSILLIMAFLVFYLIRINFRADKISRQFAHRHPNARNFIRELRTEKSCAEINPRENIQT